MNTADFPTFMRDWWNLMAALAFVGTILICVVVLAICVAREVFAWASRSKRER